MVIYKMQQKRPEISRFANNEISNYVNFLACILLASLQLLSQLTHAHYRDTVPLRTTQNDDAESSKHQSTLYFR